MNDLVGDVAVHVEVSRPLGYSSIDIETSTDTKVPGLRVTIDISITGTSIGAYHCYVALYKVAE